MKNHESDGLLRVGITQGDVNGISLEVIIKTFMDNRMLQVCLPVIYGSPKIISAYKKILGATEFSFNQVKDASQLSKHINVISVSEDDKLELGQSTSQAGKMAFQALEAAVNDLKEGKIDVLVTGPINKDNIQNDQFKFAGHTEYLAERLGSADNLMLLVADQLKVAVVTGHIPLAEVSKHISVEKIKSKAKMLSASLIKDFGVRKPKIAVLGLNPHAGDNGLLGSEEKDIVIPAIKQLHDEGHLIFGPYPADGFFGSGQFSQFDAVLAMYHDQGLIPFKSMSFNEGVNYTAGMDYVRTSPDHGTGYAIAGKNIADENSFRKAVYMAVDIYRHRKEHAEITANPLKTSVFKKERG
jgi:4-hydroxythreonine-4-phosphate dehydrogenase